MKISCIQAEKEHHPFLLPSWTAQQRSGTRNRTFLLRSGPKLEGTDDQIRTKGLKGHEIPLVYVSGQSRDQKRQAKVEKNQNGIFLLFLKNKKLFDANLVIQKIERLSFGLDFWPPRFWLAHIKSSVTIFGKTYQGNKLKKTNWKFKLKQVGLQGDKKSLKEVHLRESQTKIEKSKGKNWGSDQIYFQTKFEELCGTFHAHCSDSLVDCFWISWVSKMTQFILIRISVKTERSRKNPR